MSSAVPLVLAQGAGEYIWFGAGLFTFKVTSAQSGGVFMLTEVTMSRGKTTPFHVHEGHDETTYLIEGEMIFNLDGVEELAHEGAVVAVPRGTPHALLVRSESARLITFVTPGDAEAFYREAGEPAPTRDAPPEGTPLNMERLLAAGKRTGFMNVIGPPPFNRDADASLHVSG